MPDILEVQKAIEQHIPNVEVIFDVYEAWRGYGVTHKRINKPRVTVRFRLSGHSDPDLHESSITFEPALWPDVSPEWLTDWFAAEFQDIL